MNINYKIKWGMLAYYGIWGSLGFYRGANYYNYAEKKLDKNANVLYVHTFSFGYLGATLYLLPILNMLMFYKECLRIEINLRGLNKNTMKYYELLP